MCSSSSSQDIDIANTPFFKNDVLPNYEKETMILSLLLSLTFLWWVFVFPVVMNKYLIGNDDDNDNDIGSSTTGEVLTDKYTASNDKKKSTTGKKQQQQKPQISNGTAVKQRRGKKNNNIKQENVKNDAAKISNNNDTTIQDAPPPPSVPLWVLSISALGLMLSLFWVTMTFSPYNTFVARGVFQVPMLTSEECEQLLTISDRVAQQNKEIALKEQEEIIKMANNNNNNNNVSSLSGQQTTTLNRTMQGLLWEPAGWQKIRHQAYPTTDLNLITDPFTNEDLEWIQEKLDTRLAPSLSRIYGIPESSIRANDMFVVRYDSDYRTFLSNHTDDADISFNILLTDNFEGGGTRFWNRHTKQPFAHIQPTKIGQMLTHSALINHEGMPTTQGTRIIFVGFLSVDRIDPFSTTAAAAGNNRPPPKLNIFASWLSLPWISTKFKEAYVSANYRRQVGAQKWSNNKYAMALFLDLATVLQVVGDFFAPHHVQNLVAEDHIEQHLKALDEAYRNKQQKQTAANREEKASWFKGQQIDLDLDGTITNEWSTREANKNRFMEL